VRPAFEKKELGGVGFAEELGGKGLVIKKTT